MTAEELRLNRLTLGLDRTTFAAYLGVSYWTVCQWESGRRKVTMDTYSLRAALNAAYAAKRAGLPLPDWRNQGTEGGSAPLPTPILVPPARKERA